MEIYDVFQFFNLLQDLTVLENILLIQELSGERNKARALELLKLVGLENEIDRVPAEISGGQQQRVAIARSLAKSPKLLLGDELTGNLDSKSGHEIMGILNQLYEDGNTIILVTHEDDIAQHAHRIIRLFDGKIIEDSKIKNK